LNKNEGALHSGGTAREFKNDLPRKKGRPPCKSRTPPFTLDDDQLAGMPNSRTSGGRAGSLCCERIVSSEVEQELESAHQTGRGIVPSKGNRGVKELGVEQERAFREKLSNAVYNEGGGNLLKKERERVQSS